MLAKQVPLHFVFLCFCAQKMDKLTKFVPMFPEEMKARGWDGIDILIVSGDAYIDHPTFAPPLIARVLMDAGWRVGIIAQPDWRNPETLRRFGRPRLGCAVASGNMDSMLKIYTAGRRKRQRDMFSEGGKTGLCPPHASVVYAQLSRAAFPGIPVVLGGVEASMRRLAHYDYWQDKMRPSILADSKADILCYGFGEVTMVEIFKRIEGGQSLDGIRGTCRYLGGRESAGFDLNSPDCEVLPSFEEFCSQKDAIMRQTKTVEANLNPWSAKRLVQKTRGRLIVAEPPREPMTTAQFDRVSELPFTGLPHWSYKDKIPAIETVRDSVTAVRGCPGGCAFCGLVIHQGRQIVRRSPESILRAIRRMAHRPDFRGTITDIGGAAGNIYGHGSHNPDICRKCRRYSCLFPSFCANYKVDERPLMELLDKVCALPEVRHVFINSGVRLDLALVQPRLTEKIIKNHVSGQLSVAPEHLDGDVLKLMRKGKPDEFGKFRAMFERISAAAGKKQFLVPYFISNFPGCTAEKMKVVDDYLEREHWHLRQVQDFIPLPMTMGCAMYCAEETSDGTPITVNRGLSERRQQRDMLRDDHGANARAGKPRAGKYFGKRRSWRG